ncbi:EFR1 family ferrodoxin [uncultured Clostridium sp.]|uniref:EFR1 family ferrodoxin n=1 Tax=uncultured Clostridium sp. TaxID=59620 RepID=UPI0025886CD6|nr:EFR1 family ferrodoxin [uncultured Clostridium sp.]MDU1349966.1 EFR1 family ferrodoxin [Clostridium argentinense]
MATIFYFSGTGNSLNMARKIAEKLDGKLMPIVKAMDIEEFNDEVIGIIVPIYCMDIPNIVREFLEKVKFSKGSYIFQVVTCGGVEGIAFNTTKKILEQKGLKLSYGFTAILPDNSIALPTKEEKKIEFLKNEENYINSIALAVKERADNSNELKETIKNLVMSKVLKKGFNFIYKIDNKTIDSSKCVKCGICEKVCPLSNIYKEGENFTIGNHCENCFACAQWCPKKAISIGKLNVNDKTQYTHKNITAQDISSQKSNEYVL